jgi:nicotinate-nucleotide pyrophosphorylase (carboxylating)
VNAARQVGGFSQKIEVECRSISDALEAAESGADIVMLDNFEPRVLKAIQSVKQINGNRPFCDYALSEQYWYDIHI